ncbi:MAG: hypothetical protein AAGB03_02880 [Pseudomonadota bacterium]
MIGRFGGRGSALFCGEQRNSWALGVGFVIGCAIFDLSDALAALGFAPERAEHGFVATARLFDGGIDTLFVQRVTETDIHTAGQILQGCAQRRTITLPHSQMQMTCSNSEPLSLG